MAVFVTGDIHGPIDIAKLGGSSFPLGKTLTKDDYVIIAGDFGLVWDNGTEELYWRDWLEDRPWTTLFIDGNHENHEMLAELPEVEWNGGRAHLLSSSVIHLMRGQVYDIDGSKVFTMGGAQSVDKEWRLPQVSWWPEELPSKAEYDEAEANLDACGWKVDYVITHCCATSMLRLVYSGQEIWQGADALTEWFEILEKRLDFRMWYFGHHHVDMPLPPDHCALYQAIVPLGGIDPVNE